MPFRQNKSLDELPPQHTRLTCRSVYELLRDVFHDFILVPILVKLGRAPTKDQYMDSEIEQTLRLKHVRVMSVIIYLSFITMVASAFGYYYATTYRPCTSKLYFLQAGIPTGPK